MDINDWVWNIQKKHDNLVKLLTHFDYCETEEEADEWLATELNFDAVMEAICGKHPYPERIVFILDMAYHWGYEWDCIVSVREAANAITFRNDQ